MEIKQAHHTIVPCKHRSILTAHQARLFFTLSFLMLLFFASSHNSFAAQSSFKLPEFTADYAVTKFGIQLATASYQLRHTDNGYHISQQTKLHGIAALFRKDSIKADSHVEKVDGQLRLQSFNYVQTGEEKNRNEDLQFYYDKNQKKTSTQITGVSRNKQVAINTDEKVWDILSFQIPLMTEANSNKKHYPYTAIINGQLDNYLFHLEASKTYEFAGKEYDLLQLVRTDSKNSHALHIWLAPELHNLPVIIENYHGNKLHSRMQLKRVQFSNMTIAETDFDE